MSSERTRERLSDIIENAGAVATYLDGMSGEDFLGDRRTRDAVERCLERVIEAITQIGEVEVAKLALNVPWHQLRGLGNRLRHEYGRIDPRLIYKTAAQDLPLLHAAAERALADHG